MKSININNCSITARAFVLSYLRLFTRYNIFVLTKNNEMSEKIKDEILFYEKIFKTIDEKKLSNFQKYFSEYLSINQNHCNSFPEILTFQDTNIKPYLEMNMEINRTCSRLNTLYNLTTSIDKKFIISNLSAVIRKTIPKLIFLDNLNLIVKKDIIKRDEFVSKLFRCGYERDEIVNFPGTFSVRGGIIDMFSPAHDLPCRIELFGDEIFSLREFDPITQKSIKEIEEYHIGPPKEIIIDETKIDTYASRIKYLADELDFPKSKREKLTGFIKDRIYFDGIENIFPIFYEGSGSLFDYLEDKREWIFIEYDDNLIDYDLPNLINSIEYKYNEAKVDRLISHPKDLYLDKDFFLKKLDNFIKISFNNFKINQNEINFYTKEFSIKGPEPILPLINEINILKKENYKIFLVFKEKIQAERLYNLLINSKEEIFYNKDSFENSYNFSNNDYAIEIINGDIDYGFSESSLKIAFLSEFDIFGKKVELTRVGKKEKTLDFTKHRINVDDYVVHEDFGIGQFKGLTKLPKLENEFMLIQYYDSDKLYIPIEKITRIQKYIGASNLHPTLDRLRGEGWENRKNEAIKAIRTLAIELVHLYAERKAIEGFAYSEPNDIFLEFETLFPFTETQDQTNAIDGVINDMTKSIPMDRLICGDVGYGKTEVAMRASMLAISDNKQVAILVPTTVLAFQHEATFRKRFKNFACNIESLSRFKKRIEQKNILEKLHKGEIDIIIGTHRLLSEDVRFKDLGLLVIDEEHRFGVRDKEKVKLIKKNIDVLSLTATPIPRTLEMACLGIRDLSVIETPPQGRTGITTHIAKFDKAIIKDAITNELARSGQVFFVHNRILDIQNIASYLKRILPDINFRIAHGRMRENALEKIMIDFINKKFDVLLCTTNIGAGIDIPNANTIIINNAQSLGLSTLYQLRGRVGRSDINAYAYLLIPHESLTEDAYKRLSVIKKFSSLGAGFNIAMHDLEIRGAGNILGHDQSGFISNIGYDLYTKILSNSIKKLKGEKSNDFQCEFNIKLPVSISENYISSESERLILYQKIMDAREEKEISEIEEEILDRYGKPPKDLLSLLEIAKIKIYANMLKIKSIIIEKEKASLVFDKTTNVNYEKIIVFLKKYQNKIKLIGEYNVVIFSHDLHILDELKNFLLKLL
jgi:transcription-repair coupling factor (superfamily II helicase)